MKTKVKKDAVKIVDAKPPENGLLGLCVHTFKGGQINWQGKIIGFDGDFALVQLFSWLDGGATNVEPIHRTRIYSSECRLYATESLMNRAAEKAEANRPPNI